MIKVDKKNYRKIKMCYKLIIERKYSDAKGFFKPLESGISPGVKFAIEGIINFSKDGDLSDFENLKKLRKLLNIRLSSKWNDDFDRDYFWTWINFIRFLQRHTR